MRNSKGKPRKYAELYRGDCKQQRAVFQEYIGCVADC